MATVADIYCKSARSCPSEATLAEASKLMWEADCGALPVVDADRKVAGVITDRDICMAIATRGPNATGMKVRDAATRRVVSCKVDEPVGAILSRMAKFQVRRLPVVDAAGQLVGMISLADVIRASGKYMGPKGEDLKADDIVRALQAILVSPDARQTIQMPQQK